MKIFLAFIAIWAIGAAKPSGVALPAIALRTGFISVPYQRQFHAQDGFGQYAYGYSDGLSAKEEVKSLDGTTRGSYSYVDAEGKLQSVDYTADANGFRVAATNLPKAEPLPASIIPQTIPAATASLPQPVVDTPEVIEAKAAHFAAVNEAKIRSGEKQSFQFDPESLPKPVEDTPEVAKAKAEHFAAKKEAEFRNLAAGGFRFESVPAAAIPLPASNIIPVIRYGESPRGFYYSSGAPEWNPRFFTSFLY